MPTVTIFFLKWATTHLGFESRLPGWCFEHEALHAAVMLGLCLPARQNTNELGCSLPTRYRNFRTLSVPSRGVQFDALAVDPIGDLVASGALDSFDAYVWSLRTGQLLSVLTGHTAPVSSVGFSPSLEGASGGGGLEVMTASWDGSVRTWSLADCEAAATAGAGAGGVEVAGCTVMETIVVPTDGKSLPATASTPLSLLGSVPTG